MSASFHSAAAAAAVAGVAQRHSQLLQLHDAVLKSQLLPLVSNHTFYVVLPQLCKSTRHLLSQSHLHKQQAQRRLSLSEALWREMRRREWQLAEDEWDKGNSDSYDEKSGTGDSSAVEVQRDWSIVCRELYRRFTRLERLIFRHAPVNCYRERYQLPDAFHALLVDAWTVRLLAPHVPLATQVSGGFGEVWRARWVVRPCHEVVELPADCRGRVVSASELRHLPIVLVLDDQCSVKARRWWFVSIDCRPAAVDGAQPADLNSAAIIAWRFDPDDYEDIKHVDRGTPAVRVWDSAHEFVIDGGIRALYGDRMTKDEKDSVERLLRASYGQSDVAAEVRSDVEEELEGEDEEDEDSFVGSEDEEDAVSEWRHAVRQYIFAPWRRKAFKRKAEPAVKRSKKSKRSQQ